MADTDRDGELSSKEAEAVEYIGRWDGATQQYIDSLSDQEITSLDGIELFPNLKGIVANGNPMGNVDLSKNKNLEYAFIQSDSLGSVDVSGCSKIKNLLVSSNTQVKGADSKLKENLLVTEYKTVSPTSTYTTEFTYAPTGQLLKAEDFGGGSSPIDTFEYDANGNAIKHTTTYKGGNSNQTVYTYERDDKGRVAKAQYFYNGRLNTEETYAYDDKDNVTKVVSAVKPYNGGADSVTTITFTYDENGKLLTRHEENAATGFTKDHTISYDAKGMPASSNCTIGGNYSNGTFNLTFTRDEGGRLTSRAAQVNFGSDNYTYSTNFVYSADGTATMTHPYNGKDPGTYDVITFDDKGNATTVEHYGNGSKLGDYTFTYNEHGLPLAMHYQSHESNHYNDQTVTYAKYYSEKDLEGAVVAEYEGRDMMGMGGITLTTYDPASAFQSYHYRYIQAVSGATRPFWASHDLAAGQQSGDLAW